MSSDQEKYQDLSSNHHYRTELPNIIYTIGLSLEEIGVYFHLKRITGDKGVCFMSAQNIADLCNVSKPHYLKIRDKLMEVNESLGMALLNKVNRKKEDGSWNTPLITIVDIWDLNYIYFIQKKSGSKQHAQGVGKGTTHPPHTNQEDSSNSSDVQKKSGSKQGLPGVVNSVNQGSKQRLHKEEPFKKEPIEEEHSMQCMHRENCSADACFLNDEEKKNLEEARSWKTGTYDNQIIDWIKEHGIEKVRAAHEKASKKSKRSPGGYMQKLLSGGFSYKSENVKKCIRVAEQFLEHTKGSGFHFEFEDEEFWYDLKVGGQVERSEFTAIHPEVFAELLAKKFKDWSEEKNG